jgi:hypothetical protein
MFVAHLKKREVRGNYRPHPVPLPQERGTPVHDPRYSENRSTNPALDSWMRRETILPLLGPERFSCRVLAMNKSRQSTCRSAAFMPLQPPTIR